MLVLSALILGACTGAAPTPAAEPAAGTPAQTTATAVATEPTIEPTSPPEETGAEGEVTPAPVTPSAPAATPTVPNGTAVLTPLVVDETPSECEIESNLDLAGYLDIEERMGCAVALAKFDPVAINEFGEGPDYDRFMLWFGAEGNIYVLLPDGTYAVYPDEWQEGDPTFTCNPTEDDPDSPPLPRRGFGKVWCEQADLQEIMGTIDREERLCQHAVDQPFERGRLIACFEDASVRYFRLLSDNTWDVTTQ